MIYVYHISQHGSLGRIGTDGTNLDSHHYMERRSWGIGEYRHLSSISRQKEFGAEDVNLGISNYHW